MYSMCLAGDSRAVISQSGKAIDLTRDHKPDAERERIESSGGFVCTEGLLNGELGVARAIGDYHMPDLKQLDAGGCWGNLQSVWFLLLVRACRCDQGQCCGTHTTLEPCVGWP